MSQRIMTSYRGDQPEFATTTLAAKLHPPFQSQRVVDRPRLLARLEAGLTGRLTQICTPAGYGKTTLLTQLWDKLDGTDIKLAWLSLDDNDQDPFQFLIALSDALRTANVPLSLVALEAERVNHRLKPAAALLSILKEIEACASRIVLFLDDYHHIESPQNDALIHQLLNNQPANLHLILATRAKPGFPLNKLCLAGEALELTEPDLRFDEDDLQAFLGCVLDRHQIAVLAERTEGWPVALQLVRLWVSDGHDAEQLLAAISGSADEIAGYLAEQVFANLPRELQTFLIETSIVERINGDLADAVCDSDNGWACLDRLDRMNAFIFPLGPERLWYRPHPLFAEFLKNRLTRLGEANVRALHARASRWYEAHGNLVEAVEHASAAGDTSRAVNLAEKSGGVRFSIFEGFPAFRRILRTLPREAILTQPRLRAAEALMLMKEGKLADGQRVITEIKADLSAGAYTIAPEDRDAVDRDILIVDALATAYQDDHVAQDMIAAMEALTGTVAQSDHWFRGFLNNLLCILHFRRGNLVGARVAAQAGLHHYREAGAVYGVIFMHLHGGMLALTRGALGEAINHYQTAARLCERHTVSDTGLKALADVFLAEALYERGDIDRAGELIFHALPIVEEAEGWVEVFVGGYRTAAALAFGRGGLAATLKILDQGLKVAEARRLERLKGFLIACRLRYLIQAGHIRAAKELIAETGFSADGRHFDKPALFGWREQEDAQLVLARLALAEGRLKEAQRQLSALARACSRNDQVRRQITILVLRGLYDEAVGDMDGAAATIKDALALSYSERFFQAFVDEGEPVERLLKAVVTHVGVSGMPKTMLDWVAEVLVAMSDAKPARERSLVSEIFTEREREVLQQLKLGGSNKVIARRLDITDNAVKFHLKNIYKKLGVNGRKLALAVAEKRGLVEVPRNAPGAPTLPSR